MALHDDLLAEARTMLGPPSVAPTTSAPAQATIRRAVSSSYYALFHLLAFEATELLQLQDPVERRRFGRGLSHTGMKKTAKVISARGPLSAFGQVSFPPDVVAVARAFVELQDGRHRADYDVTTDFTAQEASSLLALAETAFAQWRAVRGDDRANLFLHLLFFYEQFSKRDAG